MTTRTTAVEQVRGQRSAAPSRAVSGALTGEPTMNDRNRTIFVLALLGYVLALLVFVWLFGGGPL